MRSDPVLELATELRRTDKAFDDAIVQGNRAKAQMVGARLALLTETLHRRAATSPQGAAVLIREAASALAECADLTAVQVVKAINPVAKRLARGNCTIADLISLRAARDLSQRSGHVTKICPVSDMLSRALRGAAAPVLVSGEDDHAPAPRARSRAKLCLVQ
jgi:hypothetical protein